MKKPSGEKWRIARQKALRAIESMSAEEDAAITAAALRDPDNPPLTDEMWARARPAEEVHPDIVAAYRRGRGKQAAPVKRLVSLRLDPEVIEHFRATGPGWQRRINDALRKVAKLKAAR